LKRSFPVKTQPGFHGLFNGLVLLAVQQGFTTGVQECFLVAAHQECWMETGKPIPY
jgi:hypothetical protein